MVPRKSIVSFQRGILKSFVSKARAASLVSEAGRAVSWPLAKPPDNVIASSQTTPNVQAAVARNRLSTK
jgi:hypothetical protein